jgi:hypothetical protein
VLGSVVVAAAVAVVAAAVAVAVLSYEILVTGFGEL